MNNYIIIKYYLYLLIGMSINNCIIILSAIQRKEHLILDKIV